MTGTAGRLVVIVGPSGAGKDSLIAHAHAELSLDERFLFVRRYITRPEEAGGEDHQAVTESEFAALDAEDWFCATWSAHGLYYGIPARAAEHVRAGGVAIVNGSRHALEAICNAAANPLIVSVTAQPDILAERLRLRGRETEAVIAGRLERKPVDLTGFGSVVEIDNSGSLAEAGRHFVSLLRDQLPLGRMTA